MPLGMEFGGSGISWNEEYTAPGGYIQEDFGSTSYYNLGTPAQPTTQYHIYQVSAQTNNWAAWMNGSLLYQTFQNSVKFDTEGAPIIGQNNSHFLGDIAEVMIFNRALTTAERATINDYLNSKYALVAAVPPTPTNLTAYAISPTQIGLSWSETLTNGGATQISIERSTASNGVFSVVAQVANALSYVDTNLTAGTTYYYQVRAMNLNTWSPYSNETNATTLAVGASAPFGSLSLWLKADAGLVQGSTNTPVDLWADQSGNGNNASQTAVANQPSWIPGAINGLPVVRFNGSNGFVNLPGFLTGMPQAEVFVVLKVAATNATHGLWTFGGSGLSWNEEYTAPGGYIQEDFGSTSYYNLGTPAQPTTQYHIYQVSAQTNNWAAWMNGSLLYQTFQNSVKFDTEGAPIIGQNNSHFLGDIAEVMIFNRALTTAERATINDYLNSKYALVAAVPPTPTNLTAYAISPTQIGLSWSETLTNGGATQISIERSTASNGVFSVVAQVANALSYIDTNLTAGTTYYYQVRAMNLNTWSPYSNETNATTLAGGASVPLGSLSLWLKADAGLVQGSTNTPVDLGLIKAAMAIMPAR